MVSCLLILNLVLSDPVSRIHNMYSSTYLRSLPDDPAGAGACSRSDSQRFKFCAKWAWVQLASSPGHAPLLTPDPSSRVEVRAGYEIINYKR